MPVSSAQARLWFLSRVEASVGDAYNLSGALMFEGELDQRVLEHTLQALLERHEILRATFCETHGKLTQRIAVPGPFSLQLDDLSHFSASARDKHEADLVRQACSAPFDLENGPMVRARLLRLAEAQHLLVMSAHHMVCDGQSIAIFMKEVATLYSAFAQGLPNPLKPLEAQYADHVSEESALADSPVRRRRLEYWQRQLAGAPALLELPTDRPRPPVQGHAGDAVDLRLSPQLLGAAREWARSRNATVPMALHACLNVLLARLSGQQDIVIGMPAANRRRPAYRETMGFFVNTLALRTDLSGDPSANDVLDRVRSVGQAAYLRQDVPFEQIVELVHPTRNASHSPLAQVLMVIQNFDTEPIALPGAVLRLVELPPQSVATDLMVLFRQAGDGMVGRLAYSRALFERSTIERWGRCFVRLLGAMAADGTQRIGMLPMLDEVEQATLLHRFNDTRFSHGPSTAIHALFEAQAARTPEAIALATDRRRWRFAELEAQATSLAFKLREEGLAPGTRAALFMGRGAHLVASMMAVLKCGAACVPLDAADPQERTEQMLADAAPRLVLIESRLRHRVPDAWTSQVVTVDEYEKVDAPAGQGDLPEVDPLQPAYVVYTSGSTGRPKGVVVSHVALANVIGWQRRQRSGAPAPRTLQYVAIGFDVAFQEIFSTLCAGGTLVLIHEGVRRDMAGLIQVMQAQKVERLILPFVALQQLAEQAVLSAAALPELKQIVTGAEQLRIGHDIREFFKRLGGVRLQNQYGPSEYPVATALDLEGDPDDWPHLPSIGQPIDNTVVRILDGQGQLVPIGVHGEIHLGGAGMALGYMGHPAHEGPAFVDDRWGAGQGERLYKTGDIGRWRSDGCIDYVARRDDQVKLRGFRIEPGEIEAHIGQFAGVAGATVMVREDIPGQKRLAAYVALSKDAPASWTIAGLKRHLAAMLPEYMVPADFVLVDRLPLTPSGKVDRRALAPPARGREGADSVMPRSDTERLLWQIWRDVLHIEAFGIEDSFFELGGHSLLTMQVVSRIRQRMGIEPPLALLFEHPTIAALAARLDEELPRTWASMSATIPRVSRDGPLPVSLSQRRMWVIQQFDPDSVAYNVSVSLRLRGSADPELLQSAFDLLVARHEGLRTRFSLENGEPVQWVAAEMSVPIERIDLRSLTAMHRLARARAILGERACMPFDLKVAPLHRPTLATLAEGDYVFLWVMHHAITDNWSVTILMRDLLALYSSLETGEPTDLPALGVEFADYAAWQRSAEATSRREAQIQFWVRRLAGLAPLNLPTDFARPAKPTFQGAKVSAALSPTLRSALRSFCGRHAVTPFVVLLAAYKLMLSRYCASQDIAVGTPIANRHHLVTEQLVGSLVNTLVMRTDLGGNPDFSQLVQRVRNTALEAYAHQDAPFDEIVEALAMDRKVHPEGLVRTLFNVPNAPLGKPCQTNFVYEPFDLERNAAQFDLSIHVDTEFGHCIHLEYSTDLFAGVSARRMLENYVALVEQVLADEHRQIADFSVLAPAQLAMIRDAWNATRNALPKEPLIHRHLSCAHTRLAERVAAIDASGRRLSHGELHTASDWLAAALRARGIGRGHRVGLSMPRNNDMLIALIGVLKSGAAYVPLDPEFPQERLDFMVRDADLSAVLAPANRAGHLKGAQVALLDPQALVQEAREAASILVSDPALDAQAQDAAYYIFTSGSTGRPKAVAVPHIAVVNFLDAMAREPGLGPKDRLLAVTTLSFDIAVLELLLPLSVGGQVIIASADQARDPNELRMLLQEHRATVMQATPSTWRALLDTGWSAEPGLRCLVGGEPLHAALAEQLLAHGAELWNMYGPTETTVWSTTWPVREPRNGVSIGRPIANTSAWVLDPHGLPCPIGVPGELCIGGTGVALGYHQRSELTAERFIADHLSDEPGARLYRTGDLCRWRHDGLLEHLGRLDHQVKIRGFRIELGEIESALLDHPQVAECVVATHAVNAHDVRLVGHVVPSGDDVCMATIRSHLHESLPDYMVPQHFVTLQSMPVLPNGKVDRSALPAPLLESERARHPIHQPLETQDERAVGAIWADLLGIDAVEAQDNFFDLGGHSLLAMRMVAEAHRSLGLRIEPRRLIFETLRQIAHRENAVSV
ncbi:amino acid adenylation domain-containing protein [Variovorax dokdonensis]|uniref:Amino acid adenylation domain-containing protein n=1 Tax=Variovorax dokdonensis TaxID=344883 RepID=A0ABT7NCD0_9BURK|nr:non-ribosomal peptide synthetase [Variovorax dokdonensis]MDM0045515.1 amino acid adenylation domain-containing protein [Variovorax dokdonensis]